MTSMLQLFDRSSPRPESASASQPSSVVFDIKQDDSSFIFEAKVPGLNKDDIKVASTSKCFLQCMLTTYAMQCMYADP